MDEALLQQLNMIGLSQAQSTIYLTLTKLNIATVKHISAHSGFHRSNIYDLLDELVNQGLVTTIYQGKQRLFQATPPEHLRSLIECKENALAQALPALEALYDHQRKGVHARIYQGTAGMKTVFRNIINATPQELLGMNIKGQLRTELPTFAKQFYRDIIKLKMRYRGIYTKAYGLEIKGHNIRYIDKQYTSPVAKHIYDDVVIIELWGPEMVAIEITSLEIAQSYRDNFELLWKYAKKHP